MTPEKPALSRRQKQSRLFGILIGVGVFLIVIAVMAVIPVTPLAVYQNPAAGIRLKYPAAWKLMEKLDAPGAIMAVVAPQQTAMDTYAENVNISFQNLPEPMSLSQFNQLAIRQFTGTFKKDIKIVVAESDRLSGHPAYRFSYVMDAEPDLRMMHIWTLVGTRAYIFTYVATDKDFDIFYPQVEAILKSFTIL